MKRCRLQLVPGSDSDELMKWLREQHVRAANNSAKHWKANHDEQVKRSRLLMERPDLPVDRIPAYNEMKRLQEENAELRARIVGYEIREANLGAIKSVYGR